MSKIKITKVKIYGWEGFRFSHGDISLGVVPAIGGRILSLYYRGREMFFGPKKFRGQVYDFSSVENIIGFKKKFGFRLFGGDKTWIAPEKSWKYKIPPLELDAGSYEYQLVPDGIKMISPVCRETGLRIFRTVRLKSAAVELIQMIKNESTQTVKRGIWDVMQMPRPCDVFLPAKRRNIRLYPDKAYDRKVKDLISSDGKFTRISCEDRRHYKFGGMLDEGRVVSVHPFGRETILFERRFKIFPQAKYAHRAMAEVYNSLQQNYMEVEIHSPLFELRPREKAVHRQIWRLRRC